MDLHLQSIEDLLRERRRVRVGCIVSDPPFEELESAGAAAIDPMQEALLNIENLELAGYDALAVVFAKVSARWCPERLGDFVRRAPDRAKAQVARVLVWPEVNKPPDALYRDLLALFRQGSEEEVKWAKILAQNKGE